MSRIWIPKFKIREPDRELRFDARIMGRFKMKAIGRDGVTVRRETPWFDNLILDQGLNQMAASEIQHLNCHVGTGNTAPSVSDSQLASPVATNGSIQNEILNTASAPPYQISKTYEYQFGQGVAEGNLAEVGVGWSQTATDLFSRALIEDGAGSPTTFPVGSDEFLNVAYQIIGVVPTVDIDTSVMIGGNSHAIIMRAANADSSGGWSFEDFGTRTFRGGGSTTGSQTIHRVYDGAIGAIDAQPSGTEGFSSSVTHETYTADSFFQDWGAVFGLSSGNLVNGISAAKFRMGRGSFGGLYEFQVSFDPDINKDDTQILTFNLRHSWARV